MCTDTYARMHAHTHMYILSTALMREWLGWTIWTFITKKERGFSLLHNVQTHSWALQMFDSMDIVGCFSAGKAKRSCLEAYIHPCI